MSYQPGVPTGFIPLNEDYLNLQQNFTQINNQWLVDHVPLTSTSGVPPNGYHTSVHLNPVSTTGTNPPTNYPPTRPPNTSGICQIFSAQTNDGINTDQTLYFLTGLNRLMQLTRNFSPSAATNGNTFLPGGLILQWMNISSPSSGTTYNFPRAFPANFFSIQLTAQVNDNSTIRAYVASNPTLTGFTLQSTSSSHFTNLFVMAIGN